MNGKLKGRGVIPDLKDDNGTTINEDMDKANTFNSFFSSVLLYSPAVSLKHDGTDGTCIQSVSPVPSVSNSRSN